MTLRRLIEGLGCVIIYFKVVYKKFSKIILIKPINLDPKYVNAKSNKGTLLNPFRFDKLHESHRCVIISFMILLNTY